MATVKSVILSFANGTTADDRTAIVKYTFNFAAGDVGKAFRVSIKLWADDTGEGPVLSPLFVQPLYTFHFGNFLFFKNDYFVVTPSMAGDLSDTKQAIVATNLLNEDPGTTTVKLPNGKLITLPQRDEIYATVSLLPVGEEKVGRSTTQTLVL